MKDGCPNTAVGEFRQGRFCEVHLTDVIHSAYHEWEQLKSKVEETEREFEDRVADVGFDPRDNPKRPSEYTEEEQDLEDKLTELGMMKREEGWLKGDLKRTMECVDEPFHENYPVGI